MISRRSVVAGIGMGAALPLLATRAAAAEAPIIVPIAVDDRVLVACGINGSDPYFFMIDTGGTMSLIDNDLARDLKLTVVASERLRGIGGDENSALYRAHTLSIGGQLHLSDVVFNGRDGHGLGRDVRGTLAAGAVTGYDSVLDFDAGEWRIYPHGFDSIPGFTAVDSTISHESRGAARMIVTVIIDDQPFRCLLDTGAPGEIILFPEAARRTRYWNDSGINYAPLRGSGIGGQDAIGRLVRAERAVIGPVTFDRPLVRLEGGQRGQRSSDGIIGLPLIRQFNLATDVRRRRVLIQPNHVAPRRARAPTSGLWVDRHGERLIVADVGKGSPAAQAGIVPGDVVVDTTLARLIRALARPPGASVALKIDHQGQRRDVTLVLADYV
ncbi:hypothetical protein EAH87_12920 [Sphingomonas koreensis]|nr:hypothetical protein EAH87_12920 [Sphingomonas koreensis]